MSNAWDEDWGTGASKNPPTQSTQPASTGKGANKASKRAQHAQLQRQLWDSAENPSRMHWLETQGAVPLQQTPPAQFKLLSRKPAAQNDDEDSEDEKRRKREVEAEERAKAMKGNREEKERRYKEAKDRIWAQGSASPLPMSREGSRGGRANVGVNGGQGKTPADQSPARGPTNGLFDPEDMGRRVPRTSTPSTQEGPIRQPKGPEGGRGGFGVNGRGGRAAPAQ